MLLDSDGHVMLSDFGIAHLMSSDEHPATSAVPKNPDAVMGTPDYISPEQALGQQVDRYSDIYSLAVTFFFLLSKKLPFKADTPIAVALLHIYEPPPSLSLLRSDISPALDRVIQQALAKEPASRFQKAGAFCAAFVSAIADGHQKSSLASVREVGSFDDDILDDFFDSLPRVSAAQPIVRVLPLKTKQRWMRRLAIWLIVCLVVLSVAGTTVVLVIGHAPPPKPRVATAVPTPKPRDKLVDRNSWPTSKTFYFDGQSQYHVLNTSQDGFTVAAYSGGKYHNFRLTMVASEIRHALGDSGYYGVIFRASDDQLNYYLFEVTPDKGSRYVFRRYDGKWTQQPMLNGPLPVALKPNTPTTIVIDVHDNTFTFFVNETRVGSPVPDPSATPLLLGHVGFYVDGQQTEVAFSHLSVDEL